jgi:hypothetical protein
MFVALITRFQDFLAFVGFATIVILIVYGALKIRGWFKG